MVDQLNLKKRLIIFVNNLEEKLLSVKNIHDQLNQLMFTLSKTHQNIFEDLNNIKNILNQTNIQQDEYEDEELRIFYIL